MPHGTLVIITNYARNSQGGGIKSFIENLADNLHLCGRDYYIIGRYGEPGKKNEKIIRGNTFTFIALAWLTCIKIRPAVIHSHANWYCIAPAVLYKLLSKVRILHTLHSVPEQQYRRLPKLLFRWLLKQCNHLHFVSFFLMDFYVNALRLQTKKRSVIYPGADHGLASFSAGEKQNFRKYFSISEHSFVIVAQGLTGHRLKYLGADLLLDVFFQLSNEFSNLVLVFTKAGKYAHLLEQKAKKSHLAENVIFTHDLPNPALANAVANIYAHITLAEGGISLALLEAMAAGNPIVATRTGGIPELLADGETGLLVNPQQQEIYNALKRLVLDAELRKTLGNRAKDHVNSEYRWKYTTAKFNKLYNSL